MSDKYQKAVEYLTKHPGEIFDAWLDVNEHPAGCLFQFANQFGFQRYGYDRASWTTTTICGCITEIRGCGYLAETPELTAAIRADKRIPERPDDIKPHHLPVFAEWQARLDRELRCKEPVLK